MQIYTVTELSKRWHLHEVTLRKMLERGDLPGFKIGRGWRVTEETVAAVESNELHI